MGTDSPHNPDGFTPPSPSPAPGSALAWVAAHRCAHCSYAHVVSLDSEPARDETFAYMCPLSGRENTFGYQDLQATGWTRALSDTHGGVRGRKVAKA